MFRKIVLALSALAIASAQIPSLGWCPEYVPMANFDMNRFLGIWFEAERYFQLSEVVSRCVMANYTKNAENKYRVTNEVTNRFTGIKRVLEGELRKAETKADEGKLLVKYTTIPLAPETKYSVLETDYDSYAVLWSCSGIGPVHTQNAWLMTRARNPPGEVLQKAYGVLDKYKISKTFFVKTDQEDCAYLATNPVEKPTENPAAEPAAVAAAPAAEAVVEQGEKLRSAITPDTPEIILQSKKVVVPADTAKPAKPKAPELPAETAEVPVEKVAEKSVETLAEQPVEKLAEQPAEIVAEQPAEIPAEKSAEKAPEILIIEQPAKETAMGIETVPERIMKVAEAVKEENVAESPKETESKA